MSDPADKNSDSERPHYLFKPGQSGNPAGRPKGGRNRLSESFLKALADDFDKHGTEAIAKTRETKPEVYVKVVASLLPKHVIINEGAFDGISDDELTALVHAARTALSASSGGGSGVDEPEQPQSFGGVPTVQ